MENSLRKLGGKEISKKTRSLDLQSIYKSRASKEGHNKRKKNVVEDGGDAGKKRKNRKEVSLSSFETADKNSRRSFDEFYDSELSSGSNDAVKLQSGLSQKLNCGRGLNNISLNLDGNGKVISIPKRRRGFIGRKKFESNQVSKPSSGPHSGKIVGSFNQSAKLNGEHKKFENNEVSKSSGPSSSKAGSVDHVAKLNGDPVSSFVTPKVRRRTGFDDFSANRTSRIKSARYAKEEDDHLVVNSSDVSSRKQRSNHRKRKDLASGSESVSENIVSSAGNVIKTGDDFPDDDEENLEQNAARMLSSRFDPSCTGFSSKSKSSKGLSNSVRCSQKFANPRENSFDDLELASADTASRVLRPRKQSKEKGFSRKRRHFYEIVSQDLDAYWFLNRRIKVFWPLDESWYYGLVNDYDPERERHHIKYDDRDEEWINLQSERFKLLLFSSEVPGKGEARRSDMGDNDAEKSKQELTEDDDDYMGNYMESEPIISWLARSSRRVKSSPSGVMKKQKTSHELPDFVSQLSTEIEDAHVSLDVDSSERNRAEPFVLSTLSEGLTDSGGGKKSVLESTSSSGGEKIPVVYTRRRSRNKGEGFGTSVALDIHTFQASVENNISCGLLGPSELWWSTDNVGLLKLTIPLTGLKEFRFELNHQVSRFLKYTFGVENFQLLNSVLLLQYGTVIPTWPMVHLEMLFVDNVVGLRFLLFEGSLKQAVDFVFLVLDLFHQPREEGKYVELQLPVTSIRFTLSCSQDCRKQLAFAFYCFSQVKNSKWLYLDYKLQRNCLLSRQLPLSECTYDNIKALEVGSNLLHTSSVSREPIAFEGSHKKSRKVIMPVGVSKESGNVNMSQSSPYSDVKHGKLPPFALSFVAAPTFFLSLHLKLLMEHSVARISVADHNTMLSIENPGNSGGSISDNGTLAENCSENASEIIRGSNVRCNDVESEQLVRPSQLLLPKDHASQDICNSRGYSSSNGMSVEISSFDQIERPVVRTHGTQLSSDLAWNSSDGIVHSPNPTGPRRMWHHNRNSSNSFSYGDSADVWPDKKAGFIRNVFGNGPKKPRTQVQYTLPFAGFDDSSKHKTHDQKGVPYKRIRRANEKRSLDGSRSFKRNLELLACDANVLTTIGDRGWRESGARVVLELSDHNEWRLAVKLSGTTKYSYKVSHILQPGTTNRYTHAMMWKGEKDWVLEFPDRTQWMLFKEMHEECYNRNIRAASAKTIPIPGVRLIEESDDNGTEVPFFRCSPKYFRQVETDVDMGMDPTRVLYDMDSDDERWILKNRVSSDTRESKCEQISEELFEKIMDTFEKVAYAQQCDHLTSAEIEEVMFDVAPADVIEVIHEHWRQKRQRKGMPLIRQLQPPLWERYQQQVKEWEQEITKANSALSNGAPTTEKPPMFAFCLKPRGLELPYKGSKQRSQRRFSVSGHSHALLGDHDGLHAYGRRSNGYSFGDEKAVVPYSHESSDGSPLLQTSKRAFSPRDAGGPGYFSLNGDGSEWNHHPKFNRNKSKKIATFLSPNSPHVGSYNQRMTGKRNGIHRWNMGFPEWSNQWHYPSEGSHRLSIEELDGSELDEFRLRDASGAAKHALNMAKLKREKAQRLLYRADLAIHKAVVALMTADAIKASFEDSNDDDG